MATQAIGRPRKVRDFAKDAQIAEDYAAFVPLDEIASRHGLGSVPAIYHVLERLNVPRRGRTKTENPATSMTG